MAIRHISHLRVIVAHPVAFQFREKLLRALLVEVLDAVSAAGRDDLEVFRIFVQQLGHKGTSLLLQVTQNPHLVGKALIGLRTAKGLVHPAIVANTNGRSQGVLDLVHGLEHGAQGAGGKPQMQRTPADPCMSRPLKVLEVPSLDRGFKQAFPG